MGIFQSIQKLFSSSSNTPIENSAPADSDGIEIQSEKAEVVPEDSSNQEHIDYETFSRVEVRVGTILAVEKIEKSNKLLLLKVDVGEGAPRQIVSGIAPYFANPGSLSGRQAMFVTNLEPRTIFGYESNGMIFAVNDEESFSILEPDTRITPGTRAS